MATLKSELLKHGMTISQLRGIWHDARRGDQAAQRRLFEISRIVPQSQEMLKDLARQREERRAAKRVDTTKRKKELTQWEKSRATLGKSGARVFAGGLPSLGKRSR